MKYNWDSVKKKKWENARRTNKKTRRRKYGLNTETKEKQFLTKKQTKS